MICTELESKEKTCHKFPELAPMRSAENKSLGSVCMAWDWLADGRTPIIIADEYDTMDVKLEKVIEALAEPENKDCMLDPMNSHCIIEIPRPGRHGFCGLVRNFTTYQIENAKP